MAGMSQSAARRQLRKRLVFTFLLKGIVGPWLRGRGTGHASTRGGVLGRLHTSLYTGRTGIAESALVH